ncbi:uncharacterized protein LOC127736040 [Mytilus californianus]|uniref:uncharacterized protein LOC127736040 n=1 Tax=Mytilus californianus TaxID=6549 RepID=UPI0022464246|nr:uncharacterized protein LOC127736040 [Mytilus californianus]
MYICNTFEQKSSTAPEISRPLLIGLNCVGILSCISVGIREQIRKTYILDTESHEKSKSLKLKFLCLFCLGCVVFRILKIAFHVECKAFVHINDSLEGAVLYDISCLSFYVVQTCFIYYFSKYQFVNSLFTFYGLIIMVVTNISSWTYHATSRQNVSDTSQNTTYRCSESNSSLSIRHLLHNVSPFTEPMLAEYPLLCLIFLSGIWPRTSNKPYNIEEDNNATYETSEMTALLQSQSSVTRRPIAVARKLVLTYCIILISGIINLPRLVIEILRLFEVIGADFFWISSITTIFEHTVLLLALVVSFRAIQHQCRPRKENTSYDIGNVLLILSFIITTGYYTLYIMAKILPVVTKYRSLFIVKSILRIIVLYLQTVYILQMTKYTVTSSRSQYFSVNYICLLIGLINFGYWISDTFIVVQYVYKFQNPAYYSSIHIENTDTFWFPFVMFYRFECFMCFYSLYRS